MTPQLLLDAIGLLDERYLDDLHTQTIRPVRRRLTVLLAAVLGAILLAATALAVSPKLRASVFSIFYIGTQEQPPAGNTMPPATQRSTEPTDSALRKLESIDIDGRVHAHYFTSEGIVLPYDGGFYTCSRVDGNAPPEDAAFWEIRRDGVVDIGAERMELSLAHRGRIFQILFDYAIVNGKLAIKVWPRDLDLDPVGNGWNAVPVGNRTDIVLLEIPVRKNQDFSHDYLLLDLSTLETTDLLQGFALTECILDAAWFTEDLRYGILMGIGGDGYWFCDLKDKTMLTFGEFTGTKAAVPYFLDNRTVVYQESLGNGEFNLCSLHIPTQEKRVILENIPRRVGNQPGLRGIQRNGGYGKHCLVFLDDGSIDLVDLRTLERLNLTGIRTERLTTSESPDGNKILIAYEETNDRGELGYGFSKLGLLDPKTGMLQMLTRQLNGEPENFLGWVDNRSPVITARDPAGGYYIYIYEFQS